MELGLRGKVAVITGGSKNIGRHITEAFVSAGAHAIILYRSDDDATRAICRDIVSKGGSADAYRVDLADAAAVQATAREIIDKSGGVDVLINNAAIRPNSRISAITVDEWDAVFSTNLRSAFLLSQAFLPAMIDKGWGRIVNIGGLDAYWGKPCRAHNVSAKMGLVGLTRALANEVARFGVTVNMVVPGTTDTYRHSPDWYPELDRFYEERKDRIPMGRLGMAHEVSRACLFLASDLASYTTAQELFVSGGAYPMVRQPADEYPANEFRTLK